MASALSGRHDVCDHLKDRYGMIRLKRLYAHDFKQLQKVEIHFPEAGRVLVQGKNEAGKSTLFEAVFFALFAQALNTETGGKNLDDLIGYDKEKARVELDLAVGDRTFRITRTLVRGKSNKWELDIERADGAVEEVRGNKPVNDRLVAELGFDAEALLNTCFVEQKKLEKLEGLSKAKREESLSKLLNLERLLDMEDKLRLRGEDEKLLTRLRHRVELAQAQHELPGVTQDLKRAESELKQLELHAQVERAIAETLEAAALEQQLETLGKQRDALRATVTRVDALDRARDMMQGLLSRYDALEHDREQWTKLQGERSEIQAAIDKHLPALEKRQTEIRRLGYQAARLTRVEAVRGTATADLQRAQSQKQELDGQLERGQTLNESIAAHEARIGELDAKIKAYDVGDALGEWAIAAQENTTSADSTDALAKKRAERDALNRTQRQVLIYMGAVVLGILVLSAVALPALVLTTSNLILGVIVSLVLAALATIAVVVLAGRLMNANRQSNRIVEEMGILEGEANARRAMAGSAEARVSAALSKLSELGERVPTSISAAQAKRIELAATLENKTRPELVAERDEVREKLNYARAQRDEVVKRVNELSPASNGASVPKLERSRDKAERLLNQWRPRIARRAAQYDLPPETEALRDEFRKAQSDIRIWQERVQRADEIAGNAARIERRMAQTASEVQEQYARAAGLLNGGAPAWSPALGRADYVGVQARLTEQFEAAGGDKVRATIAQLEKQYGGLEREQQLRARAARDAVDAARRIEQELGANETLSAQPTIEELQAAAARGAELNLEARPAVEAQVRQFYQRVGELRGLCERLERELGLLGERVNPEAAGEDLEREQRAQAQRKYGAEIVGRARRRIVQKILPATMEYMRRILPQLTRDRYHDAELDPDSYKIRVWDERAGQSGAWKEKNIFSGGTKDQFSLALRLSFALATLPHERGTSPGFIFLDEPLGSFDDERANALLYLLTEGEIGRAFDQIFLISHVPVRESKFTHRIRMENGIVTENIKGEEFSEN